jgi:hypothetical protein
MLVFSCNAQWQSVEINESQKKEIRDIIFRLIDSNTYQSKGFGLVDNDYLLEKPEIKALIPEMDSLYDTLKHDLNEFIEANEASFPEDQSLEIALEKYFDDDNYNSLDFYYYGLTFTRYYAYQEDKVLLAKIDSFTDWQVEKINRHRPKLHFAIEKYFNTGYIDELKENSTFWHRYSFVKDGATHNKCIIVYFNPKLGKRLLKIYDE